MDKLTPKQKAFADNYIKLGNATEAAISFRYSKRYVDGNAYKLVGNSVISVYIAGVLKWFTEKWREVNEQ